MNYVGTQTIYREACIQTDPFSPVCVISGNKHPEVFALSDLTYGKGLPVTSVEISFIERLRVRREWEKNHSLDITRTRTVIEREMRQWQMREDEIKILQDLHHQWFAKKLHSYIEVDEGLTQNIVDLFIYRKEKQLMSQLKRSEVNKTRNIRRIHRTCRLHNAQINAMMNFNHSSVISMRQSDHRKIYTVFKTQTSRMNAVCSNYKKLSDRNNNQDARHVDKVENALLEQIRITAIDKPVVCLQLGNGDHPKSRRRIQQLERAHRLIQEEKAKLNMTPEKNVLRFVEKLDTVNRVEQLQVDTTSSEKRDHRSAKINHLQNYLRGIVVQSKISNVSRIRKHLLDELRSGLRCVKTDSFDVVDNTYTHSSASLSTQIYDYLEATTISDMLDFLSKELQRLQCEQIVYLFVLFADRCRYQREAEETGYRMKFRERQQVEDRAIETMFALDSNSNIESYLEDLILSSISQVAHEQAKTEIKHTMDSLICLTNNMHDSVSDEVDVEFMVSELVHQFLFPTVHGILNRKR